MAANGEYRFRFFMDPQYIVRLAKLPDDFNVVTVLWSEDRQTFCFLVDAPPDPQFFVPKDEILPVQSATVAVEQGPDGDKLRVLFPGLEAYQEKADAPRQGRAKKSRR